MLYKWVPEITNWKEALFCGHFGESRFCFCSKIFIFVMFCLRTGEYSCPMLRRYLFIVIINDANRWVLVPSSYQPLLYTAYLNHGIPLKRRKIFLHSLFTQWWLLSFLCPLLSVSAGPQHYLETFMSLLMLLHRWSFYTTLELEEYHPVEKDSTTRRSRRWRRNFRSIFWLVDGCYSTLSQWFFVASSPDLRRSCTSIASSCPDERRASYTLNYFLKSFGRMYRRWDDRYMFLQMNNMFLGDVHLPLPLSLSVREFLHNLAGWWFHPIRRVFIIQFF